MSSPSPEDLYARTKEEGERRLARPFPELVSTAVAAGIDVVFGVVALGVVSSEIGVRFGTGVGHVAGSLAFGIAFIFIVVGRSELFTENFLVPIAGLDRRRKSSFLKLGELWTVSPVMNVLGGVVLILILTTHGVLPHGTGESMTGLADGLDANGFLAAFGSAIAAGALITLMTWFVEGSEHMGAKLLSAWTCGVLLALGAFNHVIVVTLELVFGIRYGADVGWGDFFENFFTAALGNLVGGIGLVTLNRFNQARSGSGGPSD